MNSNYFYRDKPVFGLDIGSSAIKVMQVEPAKPGLQVSGYGMASFDSRAVDNGVIIKPEIIAEATQKLFQSGVIGEITTRRTALSVPAARTFTRTMTLPAMKPADRDEAVRMEAEQYIPLPLDKLYVDYEVVTSTHDQIELLVVAAERKLVDSYLDLVQLMGLEPVSFEPSTTATSRLFMKTEAADDPVILIDFGSHSADMTVVDKSVVVTGTVQSGSDELTDSIAARLKVTREEAQIIKVKYGLNRSKKQDQIVAAVEPHLKQFVKEIRRIVRYYNDRSNNQKKISQIITMGGGANMPGLNTYFTNVLRMPVRLCDPWTNLKFGDLQPPNLSEHSMYITVAGLALVSPKEAFRS